MADRIKLNLFKIMFSKKWSLFLAVALIFPAFFLTAETANAFFDIPYNIASMQLNSLDFMENKTAQFFMTLVLLTVESGAFLFISANLLDWSSRLPVGLDSALVQTGWNYVNGLASLFFILIFIFIAFSYIFKTENWGMKKALPRLIIIAVLINFSLLFVQMITDMGWIAQNSFRDVFFSNNSLAFEAIQPLLGSVGTLIGLLALIPGSYLVSALIPVPFLSVIALGAIGSLFFSGGLFGLITHAILLIFFNFIIGLIFLAYTILFLARIGAVWLIAIISPLAFMAAILPSTQKYFKEWLGALFQWVFLGAVAFFLMGLGIKLFNSFETGAMSPIPTDLGDWNFPAVFYKYLFLFIYLIVAFLTAKKWMPAGTEMAWNLTTMAVNKGSKFAAEKTRKLGLQAQVGALGATAGAKRRIETRLAAGQPLSWRERAAQPFLKQVRPELAEAQATAARRQLVKDQRMSLSAKTKDMDEVGTKAVLQAELEKHKGAPLKDKNKSIALAELLIEKDAQKDADQDFIRGAWKAAGPDDMTNPLKKNALKKMLHWGTDTERSAIIGTMNQQDIDKLSLSSKENDQVIKDIVATYRSDLISRLGSQTKKAGQDVQKEIDGTIGEAWRTYPADINTLANDEKKKLLQQLNVIHYAHVSPVAQALGWKKYGAKQDVENKMDALRASLP